MRKVIVFFAVLSFVIGAGLAYAAPNVASLTNRGSVLIFPKIDTRSAETYIKIGNDANKPVDVKCYWVKVSAFGPTDLQPFPECQVLLSKMPVKQVPADFAIPLTKNQPVMIKASTGESDAIDPISITAQPFGDEQVGYLICWAVNENDVQISWNYLNGEAIVVPESGPAYEYAAWTIGARQGAQGAVVGNPGEIKFDGVQYDAMPLYLIYTFPAAGYNGFTNINLTMVQGSQNFNTMSTEHHVTRANFALWNENETPFSNISTCAWCWKDTLLFGAPPDAVSPNFGVDSLNSSVGRFRLQGKASATCVPALTAHQIEYCMPFGTNFTTYSTGLLGLAVQQYSSGGVTVNTPGTAQQILSDKITYTPFQ